MYKTIALFAFFSLFVHPLFAQFGCTDPQATNYDDTAIENDGSCVYPTTLYELDEIGSFPNSLSECSGLAYFDQQLWAHNDGGNPTELYQIDTLNADLLDTKPLAGLSQFDWEDMTESETYLFLGDFGNNGGNRTDLQIHKIAKADLNETNLTATTINFSFSDQTNFTYNNNEHNYDCEAFFHWNDSLHIFSKNWVDEKTRYYVLPDEPGTHIAQLRDSFDTAGLITGAAISGNGVVALLGYRETGLSNFLWLFFDYPDHQIFDGHKRRIELGSILTNGQTEGIVFTENGNGFVASETFSILPGRLFRFATSQWTDDVLSSVDNVEKGGAITVFPNPFQEVLTVRMENELELQLIEIYNLSGQKILDFSPVLNEAAIQIPTTKLLPGNYMMRLIGKDGVLGKRIQKF